MSETEHLYSNYQDWKSWHDMFVYSTDHAGYFSAELSGLDIEGADVLEIGFGNGSCVAWMEKQGARVSVTEISERACAVARDRGLDVLPADLPDAATDHTERFDTIIAFDVFEHMDIETINRYLDACAIMLKSGGKMLLRFPNAQSPFGLRPQTGDPTHKAQLSLDVMKLLIIGKPYRVTRYAGSFLYLGKPLTPVWFKRITRRSLQSLISRALNFIYASGIPYEPVVVIVLEKSGGRDAGSSVNS